VARPSFAELLRQHRLSLGLTQAELAERAGLSGRGISPAHIKILIAAGTHARMNASEVEKKLGPQIPHQHEIIIHHWQNDENLKRIGETADGTPVRVNRRWIRTRLRRGPTWSSRWSSRWAAMAVNL